MPISTNLNQSPYYDDYNANSNYHRILFKPGQALQARELTQLQSILQTQIERFGDNVFVDGTIIQGCNFAFNSTYQYVKLPDLMVNGAPVNPLAYIGWTAVDPSSNLQAVVLQSSNGYISQATQNGGTGLVNTLYVKYINSGQYANGQQIQTFANGTTLSFYANTIQQSFYQTALAGDINGMINSTPIYPTGSSYVFSVGDGIIFQKGNFIRVANGISVIVSQYTNSPNNVSVGFVTQENIVNYLTDSTLLDNASGYSNANAPGADRLQLIPTLQVANTNALPSNNFLTLVQWQNGQAVKINQNTQYNVLGNELARREYETSGNFFVQPFPLATELNPYVPGYFNMIVGAGLGYIDGYRVQQLNPSRYLIRQGNDTRALANQSINTTYGNYLNVQELVGQFPIGSTVYFYDTATRAISTDLFAPNPVGNVIGTATLLSFEYGQGTVGTNTAIYELYLTNINMYSGKSFQNVRSLFSNTYTSNTGLADVQLQYNTTLAANIAYLQDSTFSSLVFPTGVSSVQSITGNPLFTYRTSNTGVTFNTSGVATIVLGANVFPYGIGKLSTIQEQAIIIVPTNTCNVSLSYTGSVNTYSTNTLVSGTGTSFTTQVQQGDYISVNNVTRRIQNISNNTSLNVDSAYPGNYVANTYAKCYPANIPLNFVGRNSSITISGGSGTTLTANLVSYAGSAETFAAGFAPICAVYYDIQEAASAKIKYVNTAITYIDTALNVPLFGTISTSGNTVTGTGTFFQNNISVGYNLYLANNSSNGAFLGTVAAIANNTSLTLTPSPLAQTSVSAVYSAPNSLGPNGPWPLGFPDAFNLLHVYRVSNSNTFVNTAAYDITSQFAINKNQTDDLYNISQLLITPGSSLSLNNGDKLTVQYNMFTQSTTTPGFFSFNSYPIDDLNLANNLAVSTASLPAYTSSAGTTYQLRDSIDFRQYVANTIPIVSTFTAAGSGALNPSGNGVFTGTGFITPNQTFTYNVTYYLPRIDKLVLNSSGVFSVVEGISSESPAPPADQSTAMTISTITIPPYPTLLPSQTPKPGLNMVSYTSSQNRRYTMSDIGNLNQRITNLEYYSALNLLETSTTNLILQNTSTGMNAFKNGIFVDNFESLAAANPFDPEYAVGRNWTEGSLVPLAQQYGIDLVYSGGVNTQKVGDLVTLGYTEINFINQPRSTKSRNTTAGIYDWIGQLTTSPTYDNFMDVRVQPVVQSITNDTYNTYNSTTNITNNSSTTNNTTNIQNNTTNNTTNITNSTTTTNISNVTNNTNNTNNTTNNTTNQIIEASAPQPIPIPVATVTSTGTTVVSVPNTVVTIPAVVVSNTVTTSSIPEDSYVSTTSTGTVTATTVDAIDVTVVQPQLNTVSPIIVPTPPTPTAITTGSSGSMLYPDAGPNANIKES